MKQNILVECGGSVVVNKSYKFYHTKKLKSRKLREIYGFKIFFIYVKKKCCLMTSVSNVHQGINKCLSASFGNLCNTKNCGCDKKSLG